MLEAQLRGEVEEVHCGGGRVVNQRDPQRKIRLHRLGEDSGNAIFGLIREDIDLPIRLVDDFDFEVIITAFKGILLEAVNLNLVFDGFFGLALRTGVETDIDLSVIEGWVLPGEEALLPRGESHFQVIDNQAIFSSAILNEIGNFLASELSQSDSIHLLYLSHIRHEVLHNSIVELIPQDEVALLH
jgi:hypothetical protein